MNEHTHAKVLQAVQDGSGVGSRDVAKATELSHTTCRTHLRALFNEGKVKLEKVYMPEGGPKHVYRSAGGMRVVLAEPPSTKDLTLQAVREADGEIDSQGVADFVGFSVSTVQMYLKRLVDEGMVARRPKGSGTGRSSHGKGFLYEYVGGRAVTGGKDKAEAWFLAEGMGEAIERNRPHWRIGELFTKEERERFKNEHMVYRRSALGPRQYR